MRAEDQDPPRHDSWLVCPDSFKGTFSAWSAAIAISDGLTERGALVDLCPLADGGEGTMEVLRSSLGGKVLKASARDPLGRRIEAPLALLDDGETAVIETAAASGLALLAQSELDPEAASSAGTGDLIGLAAALGARRILLGVGGSATSDGGAGAIAAIEEAGGLREARIEVLSDTEVPFERAASVFAPQKGADPAVVARIAARLDRLAATMPRDPRGVARSGAAGGLSGALWAWHGAELRGGAEAVLDIVDFDRRAARARRVISGEGRLDAQSLEGKLIGVLARRAGAQDAAVHLLVGSLRLDRSQLAALGVMSASEASTLGELTESARALAGQGDLTAAR